MYCPNCSAQASVDQKFCRACGMELQAVAALVQNQSQAVHEPVAHPRLRGRQRAMLVWGFIMMLTAVAVGASLKLLGKEAIHPAGEYTVFVSVLAVVTAFIGMGMMCYPVLQTVQWTDASRKKVSPRTDPTARSLSEGPPNITEHTTEVFEPSLSRSEQLDTASQLQ